jgi:hypothetical protein
MRLRLLFICILFVFASVLSAKEVWLSIGGTTPNGSFRTDARIFNPSTTKDIQIQAYYLPVGNIDNSSVQPLAPITVLKRQMVVYNDVVTSLFHSSGLGAIRLKSDDDFVATQRIYAVVSSGSLGQFVGGVDASNAKAKGVIIQLSASPSAFRTNVGVANPNATAANVTWRLYDKNNTLVGSAHTMTLQPYGVVSPAGLTSYADGGAGADLSDAWLSYASDQPIVAYGSVIDNGTTDPTYIPAAEDTGVTSSTTTPNGLIINVTTRSLPTSFIDISPTILQGTISPGDTVTFRVSGRDNIHGFRVLDPDQIIVLDIPAVTPGAAATDHTIQLLAEGTYQYYCTITTCSAGHTNMQGTFVVGKPSDPPPRY